jgi:proteasome lid subunit RPN8/RPN11
VEQIKQPTSTHLQRKRAELIRRRVALVDSFSKAASSKRPAKMSAAYKRICQTNEFLQALEHIEVDCKSSPDTGARRYTVSSLFLHQCFQRLTADEKEQFFFITGSEVGGVLVLDQAMDLVHERRTAVGVEAEPKSTHRLLIKLEQFGHRLLAHFHSHPGRGPEATHPSGIDRRFQQRLETAGHVAVAAIFSRDGYIRFFRLDGNLEIEIHGTGVGKHDNNIFRLTSLDPA